MRRRGPHTNTVLPESPRGVPLPRVFRKHPLHPPPPGDVRPAPLRANQRAGGHMAVAAALCLHRRGVRHRPPQSGAEATVHLTAGAATGAAANSLPSSSSSSSSDTATAPRAAASAPASCPRPVPSSSARELSQRFAPRRRDWPAEAPRHNGAGRRRRAGQRRGFPLSPRPPAADGVRAPGRRLRAPSGAGLPPRWRGRRGPDSRR